MNNKYHILFSILLWFCMAAVLPAQESMEQDMFDTMSEGDKAVVVVVHKNADGDLGQEGIRLFEAKIQSAYPNCDFRQACTTQGAIADIPSPDELLGLLNKDGYTHVLMQTSDLFEGTDMQYLRQIVETAQGDFKHLRLGEPLLYDLSDYEELAKFIIKDFSQSKEAGILVCQDAEGQFTPAYTMLDHVLREESSQNWFVVNLNGKPSFTSLIKQMKAYKIKKVHLLPFNAKASEAIQAKWRKEFEKEGLKVTVAPKRLSQQDAFLNLFLKHIQQAEKNRRLTAKEQKFILR